jgi:hypothetical protein
MAPLKPAHRTRRLYLAAILIAGIYGVAVSSSAQPSSLEYAVKANYLYKFSPFLTWPAVSFPTPSSPFNLCLIGDDPFGDILDDAVRGQKVDGHPIVVKRLSTMVSAASCHILSIGRSVPLGAAASLAGQPVVTVTDKSRGVEGGMIEFVMQGGRVRFEIDEAAAKAGGITISSKLLGLAIAVRRR